MLFADCGTLLCLFASLFVRCLFVVCYLLFGASCLVFVVRSLLFVVCGSSFVVVCCPLCVV